LLVLQGLRAFDIIGLPFELGRREGLMISGTYMIYFSDGTANTSYTLVVGAVKHIH
jgi:hypothetical protein